MTDTMEKYVLDVFSQAEIATMRKELTRIQNKHSDKNSPCDFELIVGEEDPMGGSLVSLLANKAMMEAFVLEQLT